MERLTSKDCFGIGVCGGTCGILTGCDECKHRHMINERLAQYEDTGLTPEEILDPVEMAKVAMALKENARLRSKLAEATAERDAAVEDLTRLANGYKDWRRAMRTVGEIKADLKDCYACEQKECPQCGARMEAED